MEQNRESEQLKEQVKRLQQKVSAHQKSLILYAVVFGIWFTGAIGQGEAFTFAKFIPAFLGSTFLGVLTTTSVYVSIEYVLEKKVKAVPYVILVLVNFLAMYWLFFWRR